MITTKQSCTFLAGQIERQGRYQAIAFTVGEEVYLIVWRNTWWGRLLRRFGIKRKLHFGSLANSLSIKSGLPK